MERTRSFFFPVLVLISFLVMSISTVASSRASKLETTSKDQIECTMCAACENPCYQVPSPPPPSPPPPSSSANCPPPPSSGTTYYSPPPPSQPTSTYYPPPAGGGGGGGAFYPPPDGKNYPVPPPPNPIVPYFPFYYHTPPPGSIPSSSVQLITSYSIVIYSFISVALFSRLF